MRIHLAVPHQFNFRSTVFSHGWCALPPFNMDKNTGRLRRTISLSDGRACVIDLYERAKGKLVIDLPGYDSLDRKWREEIITQAASCLRLDEDLSPFYRDARSQPRFRWIPRKGAGRLLRAPTVFEDVVKMICTTNCSWALTEIMTANLCMRLGASIVDGVRDFPTPGAIARMDEKFLRREIRAGYRAPYILALARQVDAGNLDVERWRSSTASTEELFTAVRSVKGIGPYAAGNILKLLGRYDYLGIDSWCRKRFALIYHKGRSVSDKTIERCYAKFGTWRGLFFWLDVTKHWHDADYPF